MNLRTSISAFLIACACIMAEALPSDNYGTDACTQLVTRANTLYGKGKYAEAKVLYEQALATGDKFFAKKCTQQLQVINTLLGNQQKKQRATVFTISQDTVKINYLGGDYPIHVSGENWSATAPKHEDWCDIEIDRKKGIVKICTSPNESTDSRSTIVTVRNGNGQKKTVEVINEGSPEILRSSAQNLVFTPDGETNVVDIDANTDWHIADVPEWLHAIKGRGDIQFTARANDENKDRIAQVKIETPSKQEITINIIQGARLDSLAFSKNDLHFGPDGGDEYVRVLTDADDWRFGSFPHWCQLERIDNNTVKVHCTPNEPVDMPREASVNVTTGNQTLGINVFQEPRPIFNVIPQDGIGGRKISFGFAAGYLYPMIGTSSSTTTYSAVNYAQSNKFGASDALSSYSSSGGVVAGVFADVRLYKNLYLNVGLDFLYYKYKNQLSGTMDVRYSWGNPNYYVAGEAESSFKEDYSLMSLELPILASYRIPVNKKSNIQINLGPVFDFGLKYDLNVSGNANGDNLKQYKVVNGKPVEQSGTYKSHMNYTGYFDMYGKSASLMMDTSLGASHNSNKEEYEFEGVPFKKFNVGARIGVGYEYMGINIAVSYQLMLTNTANASYWDGDRWPIFKNISDLMKGYSQRNNLLMVKIGYTFRY